MKDIYVKFSGTDVKGDSTDSKHKDWIEVSAFSHKVDQPKSSSASSTGGLTAERTNHGEMLLTKEIDSSTPKLLMASSAGTVFKTVDIEFFRARGGQDKTGTGNSRDQYYTIKLENVVVSSVGQIIGEAEMPQEVFGLKYSKISWEYKKSTVEGAAPVTTAKGGWNLKENVIFS